MIYTLIIKSSHLHNSFTALQFARTLITTSHTINCVYFLFDGVYNANKAIEMPSDEVNVAIEWSKFALQHNMQLSVCDASAARRGVTKNIFLPGFAPGSIGELVASCDIADRVVTL